MGSWPLKYSKASGDVIIFIVTNSILFVILYFSARIINKYKGRIGVFVLILWMIISTAYGIFQMERDFDLYISGHWNNWFRWDFLLWEIAVPLYVGIPQLIYIFTHYFIRAIIEALNHHKVESSS